MGWFDDFWDFTPMGVARNVASAIGLDFIPGPDNIKGYVDAYTGKSGVEAQKEAIAANLKMNEDTNAANLAATRETNDMNYKIWQEARQEQRNYFDETNVYNSAVAQRKRLEAAGLNPALAMYEGVNAGSTQAQTVPNAPPMVAPQLQAYYQNAVDYSSMQNNIGTITQLAMMGNTIAKGAADLTIAQQSANLIAAQYETQIYEKVIKGAEAQIATHPDVIKFAIHQKVSNAISSMISALYAEQKEKATIESLVAAGKQAMSSSEFMNSQNDVFKTNKGALNSIEKRIGEASDSILWDIAKLVFGYFSK